MPCGPRSLHGARVDQATALRQPGPTRYDDHTDDGFGPLRPKRPLAII